MPSPKAPRREYSDFMLGQIVGYHKHGGTHGQISKEFNIPRSSVASVLRRVGKANELDTVRPKRSGRKPVLSSKDRRSLAQWIENNPGQTPQTIANAGVTTKLISAATIRRFMKKIKGSSGHGFEYLEGDFEDDDVDVDDLDEDRYLRESLPMVSTPTIDRAALEIIPNSPFHSSNLITTEGLPVLPPPRMRPGLRSDPISSTPQIIIPSITEQENSTSMQILVPPIPVAHLSSLGILISIPDERNPASVEAISSGPLEEIPNEVLNQDGNNQGLDDRIDPDICNHRLLV